MVAWISMISSSFEPITIIADNYRNKGNIWVRSKGTVLPAHVLWILFREKINVVWGICDGGGNVRRGKQTQVFKLSGRGSCEGQRLNKILDLCSGIRIPTAADCRCIRHLHIFLLQTVRAVTKKTLLAGSRPPAGLLPNPLLMHAHIWG